MKNKYRKGTRIRCIHMDDPFHPVPEGMIGTIHMLWDNGQTLGLVESEDQFEVIKSKLKSKTKGDVR